MAKKLGLYKGSKLVKELKTTGMFNESVVLGIGIVPVAEANTWLKTFGMDGYTVKTIQ